MTFKHLKFTESSTMQEFEKLAKEKGLVKAAPYKKVAAKKSLDLSPVNDLTSNILRLSAGLRASGFAKHAEDLENKYVAFKKADTLYETSKETGEDLVDMAHPKGSHKLEGVDGDATIETIVDQQEQDKAIVEHKPTGKLSSTKQIINLVKIVLADEKFPTELSKAVPNKGTLTPEQLGAPKVNTGYVPMSINKGNAANSTYIKNGMSSPLQRLGFALTQLQQLKKLASHDRIPDAVEKAVDTYMGFFSNIMKVYNGAIIEAAKFAETKEKERMEKSGDETASLVRIEEVLPFFVKGKAVNLGLGAASSFNDIVDIMFQHLAVLSDKLVSGLTPGFEFDEEELQGIAKQGIALINDAARVLKSR